MKNGHDAAPDCWRCSKRVPAVERREYSMDCLWKCILLLIFGPPLLLLGLHTLSVFLVVVFPYFLLLVTGTGIIAGVAAGVTAGLILRRRLPPRNCGTPLPPDQPR